MKRRDLLAMGGATLLPVQGVASGLWMMAEWAPHRACVMAWSRERDLYTEEQLSWLHNDQVRLAKAISAFEPVIMLANAEDMAEAGQRLGSAATLREMPVDSLWARDTMPIIGADGATGWNFNVWGEKYPGQARDRALAQRFAADERLDFRRAPIVAEGGALDSDGAGTLITTETCLLNPNRNPGLSRADVEQALKEYAPCRHVIWLWGSEADTVTDGHVDGLARFIRPGLVVAEITDDPEDPEFADMQENLSRLRAARDANGDKLEVATLMRPRWDRMPERGYDFAPSYVNAYFPNGGVVLPRFADEERDAAARTLFARLYPARRIVQVAIDSISESGGGIHCATMQLPA